MIRTYAAALAAIACAGCSAQSEATAFDVPPAEGPTISGSGYSFEVPRAWGELKRANFPLVSDQAFKRVKKQFGSNADVLALRLKDSDGFADNVNVVLGPAGEADNDELEESLQAGLADAGVAISKVTVNERVRIAGSEAVHITAVLSHKARDAVAIEQFYVTNDGQSYVVTFSFSKGLTAGQRAKVTEPTLVSWEWTD